MRSDYLVKEIQRDHGMGVQRLYRYPNGFGASVIRGPYTYGGDEGLWELGVVRWHGEGDDAKFQLAYDTLITDDVVGHLKEWAVDAVLYQISLLNEDGKSYREVKK